MQRTLILGANSTIAQAAVQRYATRGDRLHLVARNGDKLAAFAAPLANTTTSVADFARLDDNDAVIAGALAALDGGVDTVLVAHGDLGDQELSEASFAEAERIITANFTSVVSLLIPLANHCATARHGKLGVITSVAGDRGRPRNYTYGAAKGALNVYLQGMRTRLFAAGVTVTTLKIGPVDTPMTRDHKKHLLFGEPESVAREVVRAIDAGVAEAYIPWFWRAIIPVVKNTPERLFQLLPFLSGR